MIVKELCKLDCYSNWDLSSVPTDFIDKTLVKNCELTVLSRTHICTTNMKVDRGSARYTEMKWILRSRPDFRLCFDYLDAYLTISYTLTLSLFIYRTMIAINSMSWD